MTGHALHAGYAASMAVGESALGTLLQAATPGGSVAASTADPAAPGPGEVQLDAPRFELATSHGGRAGLRWPGRYQPDDAAGCIAFEGLILADLHARLAGGRLRLMLDGARASLQGLRPAPETAAPVVGAAADALAGAPAREAIERALRRRLQGLGPVVDPLAISVFGPWLQRANASFGLAIVDGALLLGIDIETELGATVLRTAGQPAALADFRDGRDLALRLEPVALRLAAAAVARRAAAVATLHGGRLDRMTLEPAEGGLRLQAEAVSGNNRVRFGAQLMLRARHDGDAPGTALDVGFAGFETVFEPGWWATIAGAPSLAHQMADADTLAATLRDAALDGLHVAWRAVRHVGGTAGAALRIDTLECHPQGLVATLFLDAAHVDEAWAELPGEPAAAAWPMPGRPLADVR